MSPSPSPLSGLSGTGLATERKGRKPFARRGITLIAVSFALSAVGPSIATAQTQAQTDKGAQAPATAVLPPNVTVVERAMTLLGIPYRFGGSTPDSGFDCSGLVRFVFREALGVSLPGRADQIGKSGEKLDVGNLLPGDLVFFNTLKRSMSHVGIYLGNREFLHAPSTGGVVRVDKLDLPYWLKRFEGARRMVQGESRATTLPGVIPDKTHGSEVLAGMAGGTATIDNGALADVVAATVPVATGPAARKARPAESRESARDPGKTQDQRDSDQLDSFIRKLTQKN